MRRILLAMLSAFLVTCTALAADVAGGKDPAFLKRFEGSEIFAEVDRPYDKYTYYDLTSADQSWEKHAVSFEGKVTRLLYHVPPGHTALEVLRNYQKAVDALGLTRYGEYTCNSDYGALGLSGAVYSQIAFPTINSSVFNNGSSTNGAPEVPTCYFASKGIVDGNDVVVAVMTAEKHRTLQYKFGGKDLVFADGDVAVLVDVASAKAVDDQMVTVKASDLADALSKTGKIDLYGILFDVDKTDIKPESAKTLDEVATLLKIDKSLSLQIAGHTDNTGSPEHNQKLSEGRAQAVVQALVSKYGIEPTRLVAKGYGDTKPVAPNDSDANKAKNRRVELSKL